MIRPDMDDTVFAFEKKLEIKNPSDINEQPFKVFYMKFPVSATNCP